MANRRNYIPAVASYEVNSGKTLAKVLERHGWALLRVQGSHHIYGKPGSDIRVSVPIHGNQTLKIGLIRHFMKMAGLTESDL